VWIVPPDPRPGHRRFLRAAAAARATDRSEPSDGSRRALRRTPGWATQTDGCGDWPTGARTAHGRAQPHHGCVSHPPAKPCGCVPPRFLLLNAGRPNGRRPAMGEWRRDGLQDAGFGRGRAHGCVGHMVARTFAARPPPPPPRGEPLSGSHVSRFRREARGGRRGSVVCPITPHIHPTPPCECPSLARHSPPWGGQPPPGWLGRGPARRGAAYPTRCGQRGVSFVSGTSCLCGGVARRYHPVFVRPRQSALDTPGGRAGGLESAGRVTNNGAVYGRTAQLLRAGRERGVTACPLGAPRDVSWHIPGGAHSPRWCCGAFECMQGSTRGLVSVLRLPDQPWLAASTGAIASAGGEAGRAMEHVGHSRRVVTRCASSPSSMSPSAAPSYVTVTGDCSRSALAAWPSRYGGCSCVRWESQSTAPSSGRASIHMGGARAQPAPREIPDTPCCAHSARATQGAGAESDATTAGGVTERRR
jgi:hypothetical protein